MRDALMGLLYLGLAWTVYAQARRAGTWCWPVARKVFAGATILLALVLPFTYYVVTTVGVRHPALAALEVVGLVVVGVTGLVLASRPKASRQTRP